MRVRGFTLDGLTLDDPIAHLRVHFDVNHLYLEFYIGYSLKYGILDPQKQKIEIRLLTIYCVKNLLDPERFLNYLKILNTGVTI